MTENDLEIIQVIVDCIDAGGKLLLLMDERLRLYNVHGVTMRTIPLSVCSDEAQEYIIDMIMPYL